MSLGLILSIIFIHWFADFVLQTDWQAKNKSKNNKALLSHTWTYSLVWYTIGVFYAMSDPNYIPWSLTLFVLITFVAHTLTDYFTSRLNSKLWAKGDVHNFFVSVGFDQVLHYAQLFGTFYLLTK
jgi:hypothetical protein